jgi:endonuclease III
MKASKLVEEFGGTYSKALGIDLASGKVTEIYKWFIASILFGARISEAIAINTYREFEKAGIVSPQKVLDAGWNKLVKILDRGGYVRYDFKTATKFLEVNDTLMQQYQGDLNALHHSAKDSSDLELRLKSLGKGIGEVTANIFLRELRGIWRKAAPLPSEPVIHAANELGVLPENIKDGTRILEKLVSAWRADGMKLKEFSDFEAALVRYGKVLRRKSRAVRAHGTD